jgi:hypothetical protein
MKTEVAILKFIRVGSREVLRVDTHCPFKKGMWNERGMRKDVRGDRDLLWGVVASERTGCAKSSHGRKVDRVMEMPMESGERIPSRIVVH